MYISQTSPVTSFPAEPLVTPQLPMLDAGIAIAIMFYLLRQMFASRRSNDEADDALRARLIDNLVERDQDVSDRLERVECLLSRLIAGRDNG